MTSTLLYMLVLHSQFQIYNELFRAMMTEDQILSMISQSQEYDQIKVNHTTSVCVKTRGVVCVWGGCGVWGEG